MPPRRDHECARSKFLLEKKSGSVSPLDNIPYAGILFESTRSSLFSIKKPIKGALKEMHGQLKIIRFFSSSLDCSQNLNFDENMHIQDVTKI